MSNVRANLHLLDDFIANNPDLGERWLDLLANCRDELLVLRPKVGELDQRIIGIVGNERVGCRLKKFESGEIIVTASLELLHELAGSVLTQDVTVSGVSGYWRVSLFIDFPDCETPAGAIFQLSEWLMRLGLAAQISPEMEQRLEALTE